MATLKGQNFRLAFCDDTTQYIDPTLVGMSTSCTVTLTNNTDDASHKDVVGMASLPEVVSNAWSVQVDSLDVTDVATLLTLIKSKKKLLVFWDETSTTDNITGLRAAFARKGYAYINDATFTFDDRTNSVKNLQLTGASSLSALSDGDLVVAPTNTSTFTKGQFVRMFLSSDNTTAPAKVIAAAKSLSLHVSVQLEDATTKDTEGTFQVQEPVGISYDISSNALVRSGETITSAVQAQGLADLETIYEAGTPVKWKIANVSGANNRTAGSVIVSGSCVLTQLQITAQNRQSASYQATLNGYGDYTVGS